MSDGLIPTILRFKLNKIHVYTKKFIVMIKLILLKFRKLWLSFCGYKTLAIGLIFSIGMHIFIV